MKKICQRVQRFISLCLGYAALSATAQPVFTNLNFFTSTASDGGLPVGLVTGGVMLFGATQQGGSANGGTVYVMGTNGANYSVLYNFTNQPDGAAPNELLLSGGTLYGTTYQGGITNNYGTIFKIGTNGTGYTVLRQFTNSPDAQQPVAGLVLGGDTLYGTSLVGGSNNSGTVFKIDTNGGNYAVLRHFTNGSDGSQPRGRLLLIGASLYGTTAQGGSNGVGTVFKLNTNGAGYSIIYNFSGFPNSYAPWAGLTSDSTTLYGVSTGGGGDDSGTVFSLGTNGGNFTILHALTNSGVFNDGLSPQGSLLLNGGTLYGTSLALGTSLGGTLFQLNTNGTGFTVLKNFTSASTGSNPKGQLILAGKTIYGICSAGGPLSYGSSYRLQLTPSITLQPQGLTVTNGSAASFTSGGDGIGTLSYQWNFNGAPIGGATATNLNFASVATNHAGSYALVVSNFNGSVTSSPAILTVLAVPSITAEPSSVATTNGGAATFTVSAVNGPLTYQWYFNTNNLLLNQTNSTLLLTGVTTNNAGSYFAIVANNLGSVTSAPALLSVVSQPVIGTQPQNLTVTNGDIASFTVIAVGQAPLSYQWFSNSVNTALGTLLTGRTNSTLSYTNVGTNLNARYYTVIITNSLGRATSSPALLTVISKPVIVTNPQPATVYYSSNASFNVSAIGLNVQFRWYSNSVNTALGTFLAGRTNSTLLFTNVGTNFNARYFSVVASNSFGTATSTPALLTVISTPTILLQPQPLTAIVGEATNFTVVAAGLSPLRYQWYFNTNLVLTNLLGNALATQTNNILNFSSVSNALAGYYNVIVTNTLGRATSSPPALLTISIALFITQQPSNAVVTNGSLAAFTSAASGQGTLGYQWLFNTNTPIPGATTTNLVITNANQPGAYSMKVTNSSGAATSSPAWLTVVGKPILLSSAFDATSGSYTFSYVNLAGSTNRLWASTNLSSTNFWKAIATNFMATNGTWQVTDPNAAKTNAVKFYRFSTP